MRERPAREFHTPAASQIDPRHPYVATGKQYPRGQLLTIAGLLSGTHRAEHPDHAPDLTFKKAKAEAHGKQQALL